VTQRAKRWKPVYRRVRFLFLRAVLGSLARLPRALGLRVFGALGSLAFSLLRKPRELVLENTRIIFPDWGDEERNAFARRVFYHMGRNGFDFLRLHGYSRDEVCSLAEITGREHLERALRPGVGVVCLGAHLGCWEFIPYRLRAEGYPVAVVYRRLSDPDLDRFVAQRRRRFGIEAHDRDASGRGILRSLRNGALVGMLIDQRTRVDSVKVPFLGTPAWTPSGPVRLALRVGAPLVPLVTAMGPDGRHRLVFGPEIAAAPLAPGAGEEEQSAHVREITARCNEALGKMILEWKEQWVWFHPRWVDR